MEDLIPENIKKIFQNAKFEKEIIDFTKKLFNETIKKHCKPIYISKQKMIVAVDNPLWANEIVNYKNHFLQLINKKFSNYIIDLVPKFLPKYFSEKKKEEKLSDEDKIFIEEQLKNVEDKELKDNLYKLIETFIIIDKK